MVVTVSRKIKYIIQISHMNIYKVGGSIFVAYIFCTHSMVCLAEKCFFLRTVQSITVVASFSVLAEDIRLSFAAASESEAFIIIWNGCIRHRHHIRIVMLPFAHSSVPAKLLRLDVNWIICGLWRIIFASKMSICTWWSANKPIKVNKAHDEWELSTRRWPCATCCTEMPQDFQVIHRHKFAMNWCHFAMLHVRINEKL